MTKQKWEYRETAKGQKEVVFTGKISKRLHDSMVKVTLSGFEKAFVGRDELEKEFSLFWASLKLILGKDYHAFTDGEHSPFFDSLNKELGCKGIIWPGGNYPDAECHNEVKRTNYRKKTIEKFFDMKWQIGTPVEVQWAINTDGKSFQLKSMASTAWEGAPVIGVLDIIFE